MDDIAIDRLLSGDLHRLPSLPKRVVRLFISSTFTDMTLERNSLMERVYPKLKRYCRERHGLDFQVVDMRWGVRDEATDDHQTVNLCSREIENCQRVSLGPNFVALIGDKYGFRPLLNRIKSTEYRSLRRCLIEADINTDFLDTWYKEDQNAVPAEYLLQPISSILKNFTNRNEPELQMMDQRIWLAIQERLHKLLLIGSGRLVRQGRMSERERSLRYSISVTEREVLEGCLNLNETKSHCLVYVRSIVDLRDQLNKYFEDLSKLNESQQQLEVASNATDNSAGSVLDRRDSGAVRKASLKIGDDSISLTTSGAQTAAEKRLERQRRLIGKYIDLASKDGGGVWQVDEEAQEALNNLREVKLRSKLSPNGRNLTIYQVHWNDQDGISVKSEEHKRYLNELTDHFYQNLVRMIRGAVKSERSKVQTTGLIGEVLQHSHYSIQVGKRVHGRSNELDLLRYYIVNGTCEPDSSAGSEHHQTVLPVFLYGTSGSGKTSVLARVATLARDWIKQSRSRRRFSNIAEQSLFGSQQAGKQHANERWDRKPCLIVRFCCTTPASSSMVATLTSVCRQLQYNFYQFGPLSGLTDQQQATRSRNGAPHEYATTTNRPVDRSENQLPYQQIPQDFVRLVYTFRRLLDNCRHPLHRRRQFVFIIDSIERLVAPAECTLEAKYSWLTSLVRLPPNVRLLVSCGSSGETKSALNDFLYLKRHFLQLHFKMHRASIEPARAQSDSTADQTCEPSGDLDELQPTVSSVSSLASLDGELRQNERQASKYEFIRRLILPATRLARGSRGLTFDAQHRHPQRRPMGARVAKLEQQASRTTPQTSILVTDDGTSAQSRETSPGDLRRISSSDSMQSAHRAASSKALLSSGLLHIRPLGPEVGKTVLRRWLAEIGRNLSQQQWSIVERSLHHCSRPIFVKLAFGEVINWKSYSMQGDTRGLTFGSAWLGDFKLDRCAGERPEIAKLSQSALKGTKNEDQELKTKWQMLAMEQQWLNYLDYRSRKQEDSADLSGNIIDRRQGSGNLVIRIGGAGSISDVSAPNESGGVQSAITGRLNSSATTSSTSAASSASICHLSDSIGDAICQLFARIELKHGYLLTKHSLSYITASRNGICENELEDILSLDDVVLDDVFQYHLPPVRRIPPLLWTRIRSDLPDYLSERDADGIAITWHHNQFNEVTERRYLAEDKQIVYVHSLMADYFLGKWANKPKPFRCTKQQVQMAAEQLESAIQQSMRRDSDQQSNGGAGALGKGQSSLTGGGRSGRFGSGSAVASGPRSGTSFSVRSRLRSSDQHDQRLQWMQAKAHRRVPQQPLYYEASSIGTLSSSSSGRNADSKATTATDGSPVGLTNGSNTAHGRVCEATKRRYNLRKLTELPFHLMRSGRFLDLASLVFFNYNWLFASIDALGLQSMFADLEEARQYIALELASQRSRQLENTDELVSNEEDPLVALHPCAQSPDSANELAVAARDNLSQSALMSLDSQLQTLSSTLRLSASSIHSSPQMLAPQLIGRLLPAAIEQRRASQMAPEGPTRNQRRQPSQEGAGAGLSFLSQLLEQCDKFGCSDCALLPVDHCLQSADGLQLSSLEAHPFGVMAMRLASDQRHLLAVSSKFIMWNISTGEIARDVDPKLNGAIMRWLLMSGDNKKALACTSDSQVIVFEILTQQVARFDLRCALAMQRSEVDSKASEQLDQVAGMRLIDEREARRFFVWTRSGSLVVLTLEQFDQSDEAQEVLSISLDYTMQCRESLGCSHLSMLDLSIEQTSNSSDLLLVTLASTADSMRLVTAKACNLEVESDVTPRIWTTIGSLDCRLLALSQSLKQIVYVDSRGSIMLSRRRTRGWSRGKMLLSADQQQQPPHDESGNPVLAIEVEASPLQPGAVGEQEALDTSSELYAQLAEFEAKIDGECNEIEPLHRVFSGGRGSQAAEALQSPAGTNKSQFKFVKLYYSDHLEVVQLHDFAAKLNDKTKKYKQFKLLLPRQIRNVSLEPNKCQLSSSIIPSHELERGHYLVVAATRNLLVYSVEGQHLLRDIEAHAARITAFLPVTTSFVAPQDAHASGSGDQKRHLESAAPCAIATSSVDRTIKIWNLANLSKEERPIDRLAHQFDSMRLSSQHPLAACLSRGQLSLWDWSSCKLLGSFECLEELLWHSGVEKKSRRTPFTCCRYSANGRYLALANASASIALMSIEGPRLVSSPQAAIYGGSAEFTSGQQPPNDERGREADSEFRLKTIAATSIFGANGDGSSVLRMKFMAQDSRIIVIAKCHNTRTDGSRPTSGDTSFSSSLTRSEASTTTDSSTTSGQLEQPYERLTVSCLTVPDLRLSYSIECLVPTNQHRSVPSSKPQFLPSKGNHNIRRQKTKHCGQADAANESRAGQMVALTHDQQFIVVAETKASGVQLNQAVSQRRCSSGVAKLQIVLSVYSTRDGQLVKSIELSRLQTKTKQLEVVSCQGRLSITSTGSRTSDDSLLQANRDKQQAMHQSRAQSHTQSSGQTVGDYTSLGPRQFNRLKTLNSRERPSIVALLDDERGLSYLVDVGSKLLVGHSNTWSGITSSDGRYGLTRMFASSVDVQAGGDNLLASSTQLAAMAGLKLLEMRNCRVLKSLLSFDELSSLTTKTSAKTIADSGGNGNNMYSAADATAFGHHGHDPATATTLCGFTKTEDAYVYFCQPRARQLLLVRVRDSQVLANYKLACSVSSIKCSNDGMALVLAQTDGSLMALAIVDPQSSESQTRLSQYSSRRQLSGQVRRQISD